MDQFLAVDNVTNDKRYNKLYCKKRKNDSIKRFEAALKEELAKLECKMKIGISTLRKLAEKIRSLRWFSILSMFIS